MSEMVLPEEIPGLVLKAREGDSEAFACLVESFERTIYALALQKLGHPEDAQDIAQDTFLEAFRTLDRLRIPAAFPGWIRKIALNLSYQRLRKRAGQPEIAVGTAAESLFVQAEEPPQDLPEVDPHELPGLVLRAISRVPEAYQLPLMLRYLEKLAPQQIAQELGMNPNTVRVTLHRGSNLLRRSFEEVLRERGIS